MTLDFIAIRDNQIRIRELKNFIRPFVAEIRSRQLTISRLRAYHVFETAITNRDNKIKILERQLKEQHNLGPMPNLDSLSKKEAPLNTWQCLDCKKWDPDFNKIKAHVIND